jgi:hypothetical protein
MNNRDDLDDQPYRPKQTSSEILLSLIQFLVPCTLFISFLLWTLILLQFIDMPIYMVGVIFVISCFTLLLLVNLWIGIHSHHIL